jgi:hypothetical protein
VEWSGVGVGLRANDVTFEKRRESGVLAF